MIKKCAAEKMAKWLLNELGGKEAGWKIEVWENMGWHYRCYNGCVSVYQDYPASSCRVFICWDPKDTRGGGSFPMPSKKYKDPVMAVKKAIEYTKVFELAKHLALVTFNLPSKKVRV